MSTKFTELLRMKDTTDFRYIWTLSAGEVSSSGQQDVGHEGVATGSGALSLCSF